MILDLQINVFPWKFRFYILIFESTDSLDQFLRPEKVSLKWYEIKTENCWGFLVELKNQRS
jgi:hypothetical protein